MKIAGIIAEYNPFHNGHAYHINQVRQKSNADYLVIVMSGNFMQRGVPAMLDKYQRAKMALMNGADLVLELPCMYACSSAEYFAKGAVTLLDNLNVVNHLGFGCENDNLPLLQKTASILANEPDEYRTVLQDELRKGSSFPIARSIALSACLDGFTPDKLPLSSPNNILAVEYLKALYKLNSSITPIAIKREGANYSDEKLHSSYSSALAIRNVLFNPPKSGESSQSKFELLKKHVPESVLEILQEQYLYTLPITTDDFSSLLHYKLLLEAEKGYDEYLDVSKDLSDKIKKNLNSYTNFDSFCMLLKSKELTYTRICRCMIHILLSIKKTDLDIIPDESLIPYARVLGFKNESSTLLKEIKNNSKIPLISVAANAKDFLFDPKTSDYAKNLINIDITASRIYNSAIHNRYKTVMSDEFAMPLLKI